MKRTITGITLAATLAATVVFSTASSVLATGTCGGNKFESILAGSTDAEAWAYDKNGDGIICYWLPPRPTKARPISYGDNKI